MLMMVAEVFVYWDEIVRLVLATWVTLTSKKWPGKTNAILFDGPVLILSILGILRTRTEYMHTLSSAAWIAEARIPASLQHELDMGFLHRPVSVIWYACLLVVFVSRYLSGHLRLAIYLSAELSPRVSRRGVLHRCQGCSEAIIFSINSGQMRIRAT